jgi:hypothetical protein
VKTFLALLVTVGAGCEVVGGIDQRQSVAQSCNECVQASCTQVRNQCLAAPACQARMSCLDRCRFPAPGCGMVCATDDTSADYEDTAAFEQCRSTLCGTACASSCGEPPLKAPRDLSADCAACMDANCCSQSKTCAQTNGCYQALECMRAWSTPDGISSCLSVRHPEGAPTASALLTCQEGKCAARCGLGRELSCLGNVGRPTAATDDVSARFRMVDFLTTAPLVGIDVKFCKPFDLECIPIAQGTSDAAGWVNAKLPTAGYGGRTGFAGYLEITDPSGAYYPQLFFVNPPITQPNSEQDVPLGSRLSIIGIAQQAAVTLDPRAGIVAVRVRDCSNHLAPGITLTTSMGALPVVYSRGVSLTTTADETDHFASAAIPNVPVTPKLEIRAQVKATGVDMGSAPIFVRAGTLSSVVVVPSPK